MKSMLDTLDLTGTAHGFDFEPTWAGGYMKHAQEWPQFYNAEYADNLRTALEAALSLALAQNVYITCVPEHEADEAMAELNHRQALLETALEPFKVASDDTKEAPK